MIEEWATTTALGPPTSPKTILHPKLFDIPYIESQKKVDYLTVTSFPLILLSYDSVKIVCWFLVKVGIFVYVDDSDIFAI